MNIEVSYDEVKKRYPVLVDEIMAKLRGGTSKHKNAKPEELLWSFDWSQRITGACTFGEMLASLGKPKPPRLTVQERIAEVIPNLYVTLQGSIGRWWGRTEQIPVSEEVISFYRESYEKDEAEYRRYSSLSKAEQGRELHEAISQLSKSPGFVAFGVEEKPHTCLSCSRKTCDRQPEDVDPKDCKDWKP